MSIQPERIKALNREETRPGDFVLYWMQASQRAESNHALEFAVLQANELRKPLIVYFGLTERFPEANERSYAFMLEGLAETREALERRGILMVLQRGSPAAGVAEAARRACFVVVDRGYLRIERRWRERAARSLACPLVQVETNVIVPVETASPKEEFAAATLRPKINRVLPRFLQPVPELAVRKDSLGLRWDEFESVIPEKALDSLDIDRRVKKVVAFRGGSGEARKRLDDFIRRKLDDYAELRNDPSLDSLSRMSPYLHFGQVSPLEIALRVKESGKRGSAAYLEELIVRRELSMNFVFYNPVYDEYEGLPEWSRVSLEKHGQVPREYTYSRPELDKAGTHDPYWNAAQKEMVLTGKMHGYMRMYWGKKILEWSRTPREAFGTALFLNNRYELDGRDPNGFAGVAWCFGKHDRGWPERPVFGKVRYMNAAGLRRKFDADAYVRKMDSLEKK